MNIAEIKLSQPMLKELEDILNNRTLRRTLEAVRGMKMPTLSRLSQAPQIPGVHHDTTVAHAAYYDAGWTDAINFLISLPTGTTLPPSDPTEEEFAHDPNVREIDEELKRLHQKV